MSDDKPTIYEEGMFDHVKVDNDKPTMPYADCFQQGMGTEQTVSYTHLTLPTRLSV